MILRSTVDDAALPKSAMPNKFSSKQPAVDELMTVLLEAYHPVCHDLALLKHMMGPSSWVEPKPIMPVVSWYAPFSLEWPYPRL